MNLRESKTLQLSRLAHLPSSAIPARRRQDLNLRVNPLAMQCTANQSDTSFRDWRNTKLCDAGSIMVLQGNDMGIPLGTIIIKIRLPTFKKHGTELPRRMIPEIGMRH